MDERYDGVGRDVGTDYTVAETIVVTTFTGKSFPLFAPVPDLVDIRDVAHATANIGRFTGHTNKFYSVAQHQVVGSFWLPAPFNFWYLLHDAPETYIGDINRPLKNLFETQSPGVLKGIEDHIADAIALRYGLPFNYQHHKLVKEMDNIMLATERRDLLPQGPEWADMPEPLVPRLRAWSPKEAEDKYLERFYELDAGRLNSDARTRA